jgi:hypothetical protein
MKEQKETLTPLEKAGENLLFGLCVAWLVGVFAWIVFLA